MYISVRPKERWHKRVTSTRSVFDHVTKTLFRHEDTFHLLLGKGAIIDDAVCLLDKQSHTKLADAE